MRSGRPCTARGPCQRASSSRTVSARSVLRSPGRRGDREQRLDRALQPVDLVQGAVYGGRLGESSAAASSSRRSAASGVRSWCEASALNVRSRAMSSPTRRELPFSAVPTSSISVIPVGAARAAKSPSPTRRAAAASVSSGRAGVGRGPAPRAQPAPQPRRRARRAPATPGGLGGDTRLAALRADGSGDDLPAEQRHGDDQLSRGRGSNRRPRPQRAARRRVGRGWPAAGDPGPRRGVDPDLP